MTSPYEWDKPLKESKDIFESDAQVLVNPVNCVGVMGAGLAKEFRKRYANMYLNYKSACAKGRYRPGWVYIQKVYDGQFVANLATKNHYKDKSQLKWIVEGIRQLREDLDKGKFTSVAIPQIGCGLGGLDWKEVRPLIIAGLKGVRCDIWLDGKVFHRNRDGINHMVERTKDGNAITPKEFKAISDINRIAVNSDFMDELSKDGIAPKIDTSKTIQTCRYCGTPLSTAQVSVSENGKQVGIAVCRDCMEKGLSLLANENARVKVEKELEEEKARLSFGRRDWRNEPMTDKQKKLIREAEKGWEEFQGKTRGEACDYIKRFLEQDKRRKWDEHCEAEAMFINEWGEQR